jgi:hypothetical protein
MKKSVEQREAGVFIVRISGKNAETGHWRGTASHVATGRSYHFASLQTLMRFLLDVLGS